MFVLRDDSSTCLLFDKQMSSGNCGNAKNTWNARAILASQARLNDLQSHQPKQNMKNILTNLEICERFEKYFTSPLALFFRSHIWKSPAAINAGKPFV